MKKRIIALLLLLTMVCALFAGCGKNEEAEAPKAETLANDTLPAGTYEVLDEDEVIAVLVSTGKKLTVYDADGEDGEELMEESKFSYDKDEEAFMIDDTKAFSLEVGKKETTITVPKKSPLGIDKGSYTLQAAGGDEDEVPTLEKGTYNVLDEDGELVAVLECTGKKIAVYSPDDEELMEESKFSYDEDEEAFMIDDTAAFTLEVSKKTITITVPKKSPLGLDKGTYTLQPVDEVSDPEPTAEPTAEPTEDQGYCRIPYGCYEVLMDDVHGGYMIVETTAFTLVSDDGERNVTDITFSNATMTYTDGQDEIAFTKSSDGLYTMLDVNDDSLCFTLIPCSESDIPGTDTGEFDLSKLNPNTIYDIISIDGKTLWGRYPEVFLHDDTGYEVDDGGFYTAARMLRWDDSGDFWYFASFDINDYAYYGETEAEILDCLNTYFDDDDYGIFDTESDIYTDSTGFQWYYRLDLMTDGDSTTMVSLVMISPDGSCLVHYVYDIELSNAEDYYETAIAWLNDAIETLFID